MTLLSSTHLQRSTMPRLVREGLLFVAVIVLWAVIVRLCNSDRIVCDVLSYFLRVTMQPAWRGIESFLNWVFQLTGLVTPQGTLTVSESTADRIAICVAIPAQLAYLFLLGALICTLWRFVRGLLQRAFGKAVAQS